LADLLELEISTYTSSLDVVDLQSLVIDRPTSLLPLIKDMQTSSYRSPDSAKPRYANYGRASLA
jgi:hypothetical protein